MTHYAKYTDIYRQRIARSQDTRHISPVRTSRNGGVAHGQQTQLPQQSAQQVHSPHSSFVNKSRSPMPRVQGANALSTEIPSHLKMTGDRAAYMTFLEVQLERVTQACNNALSFQEKVDGLQVQMTAHDEKMQNVSRLVKLLQSFSEAQEEDLNNVKSRVQGLGVRSDEIGHICQRQSRILQNLQGHQMPQHQESMAESGQGFGLAASLSPQRRSSHQRSLSKSNRKSPNVARSERKTDTIGERVSNLETLINNLNSNPAAAGNNFYSNMMQSNSFGTLEPPKTPGINQLKEDLNNLAQEVDRQMHDVEARVVSNLGQHFEEQLTLTNSKVDEALLLLDERMTKLQQMTSPAFARPSLIESTQIVEDGRINPAKMEEALNEWLSKVEEQVNQIEEKVNTRAAQIDLSSLEHRLIDTHEEREIRFQQLESYCQRMCDQGNTRYNEMKEGSLDWEDRFLQIQRHVEQTLDDQSRSIQPDEARESLLRSGLTSQFDGVATGGGGAIDLSLIRKIEKKLVKRMSEGVDRLGTIIKDMARTHRRLDTRTVALELKVFGKTKNSNDGPTKKKAGKNAVEVDLKNVSGLKQQTPKSGVKARKNSNTVPAKSPKASLATKAITTRRRSQKTFSPPVKDASHGPHRRSRSKSSIRPRSATGIQSMLAADEQANSMSARNAGNNLNNFRSSFEQRLISNDGGNDVCADVSPREILRRARDRSVREMSHSLNESRSRSPHSNHRIQNLVELEQASPHHHRLSSSANMSGGLNANFPQHQQVSILNGPVAGQKNIIANEITQGAGTIMSSEMEQFQNRINAMNTGVPTSDQHQFMSLPQQDLSRTSSNKFHRQVKSGLESESEKKKLSITRRSQKETKVKKASRSASRDRQQHEFTLQELEKRDKSLKKKLIGKNFQNIDEEYGAKKQKQTSSRSVKGLRNGARATSRERSLSQRTFQRMNAIGQNTLLAAQKGSNAMQVPRRNGQGQNDTSGIMSNNHLRNIQSSSQLNSSQTKHPTRTKKRTERNQISPNRAESQLKTTKSFVNVTQDYIIKPRSKLSDTRGRSRSANNQQYQTDSSAERPAKIGFRGNQTAAHEIFNQKTLDQAYHTVSQNHLDTTGGKGSKTASSRRSPNMQARKRSISVDRVSNSGREERKVDGKKKAGSILAAKQGTPTSTKKSSAIGSTAIAGKAAKQKLKNLQNKKSNQRLARLEKMYQELTEIEAKTSINMV